MKKKDIQVGKRYHNGKAGRFYKERLILAEGPEYTLYSGQEDSDCVRYKIVKIGAYEVAASADNMTRTSFASWAKGIVEEK